MNLENKLLITEHNIHDCIDRLLHEFKLKNIHLNLIEVQDIFSRTLGFDNWNLFYGSVKQQLVLVEFSKIYTNLSELQKNNLLDNFFTLEDVDSLKTFIRSQFNGSYTEYQDELIKLFNKLVSKTPQFQEEVVSFLIDYLNIEYSNSDDSHIDYKNHIEKIIGLVFPLKISPELLDKIIKKYHLDTKNLQEGLIVACENNRTTNIKHLLLHYTELNIDDVFFIGDSPTVFNPLCSAIQFGHLETAKLLLCSPELHKNANINIHNSEPLFIACSKGNLELVKFLLISPELIHTADMQHSRCLMSAHKKNHLEVVQFLLYDMNMPISPRFYENSENKQNDNVILDDNKLQELTHMIEKRDLFLSLNNKLSIKQDKLGLRGKI